jgi:hypothetical protein
MTQCSAQVGSALQQALRGGRVEGAEGGQQVTWPSANSRTPVVVGRRSHAARLRLRDVDRGGNFGEGPVTFAAALPAAKRLWLVDRDESCARAALAEGNVRSAG